MTAAAVLFAVAVNGAFAHSIDYLASAVSPTSTFNGSSGNLTVTNAVVGGSPIAFTLQLSINTQGNTTSYPRAVTFGAATQTKPAGAPDPTVALSPSPTQCTFANSSSLCSIAVTITAPATAGNYSVKIQPTSGTGGPAGLGGGGGISVNFTVATPTATLPTALNLVLGNGCVLYHQGTANTFTATLLTDTATPAPVPGATIQFTVDGQSAGSAVTDSNGVATLAFSPSALAAGDHTVLASFAATTGYEGSQDSETLGVTYLFLGFQQPINADGSSVFGGKAIPVKIKVADANGAAVPDAGAYVFFAFGTPVIVGTDAEPLANTNADSGNAMRYDLFANQYIFNRDTTRATSGNGTYTVRVDLGEGQCGDPHTAVLSLQRKGK